MTELGLGLDATTKRTHKRELRMRWTMLCRGALRREGFPVGPSTSAR